MDVVKIDSRNRAMVNDFLISHWYTTKMILRGKEVDMTVVDGFFMSENSSIIGLITYHIQRNTMEILSLDSLRENQGLGTLLLDTAIKEAQRLKCSKIVLITTNDNINALRFYQKRGFDMVHLYYNSMVVSRRLKPEIPLIGENSIPLKHEIEFQLQL